MENKKMTFHSVNKKLYDLPPSSNETFWEKFFTNKPKTKKEKQVYYNIFYRVFDEECKNLYRNITKKTSLPIWEGMYINHVLYYENLTQEERTFLLDEMGKRETTI
jgi:hypothetical protein